MTFQEAERAIEEEKQRILKENEEERKREVAALEEGIRLNSKNKDLEKQLEKIKKELSEIHERQARIKAENDNLFIRYHPLKFLVDFFSFCFFK